MYQILFWCSNKICSTADVLYFFFKKRKQKNTGLTIISENSLNKVNIKLKYDKADKSSILLPPFQISIIMTLGNLQKFYVEIHFSKALKHWTPMKAMELLACLKLNTLTSTFSIQSSIPSCLMKSKESLMPKNKMLFLVLESCGDWG